MPTNYAAYYFSFTQKKVYYWQTRNAKKRAFEGLKFVIFLGMFTGLHWVQIQFKITITLHSCNLIKSKVRVIVIDQTQSACNCNCSCN